MRGRAAPPRAARSTGILPVAHHGQDGCGTRIHESTVNSKHELTVGTNWLLPPHPQPLSPTGARGELTKFFCPCPLPSERVGGFEGAGRQAARFRTDSPAKQSRVLFYGDKNRAGVNDPAIALQRSQVKVSRVIGMAERDFSIPIEVIL